MDRGRRAYLVDAGFEGDMMHEGKEEGDYLEEVGVLMEEP
jgi:hypothetical protein